MIVARDVSLVALVAILVAMVGGVVWSVWRHRVVEDLHAIRQLLERRERWDDDVARYLAELAAAARQRDEDDAQP